jgi:DNA mismatch endonuclease (patch repair protein)
LADVHSPDVRSKNMRAIRHRNTKPELLVRKALHARGFRYRMNVKSLPGTPDLVFPKFRSVIFVHGCFWHMHSCPYFKMPKTRTEFWSKKITTNVRRDEAALAALDALGWRYLVVWECTLKTKDGALSATLNEISDWITNNS